MTRVLIPTHVKDTHAIAVEMALALKGHSSFRWFGADCPRSQAQSIRVADGLGLEITDRDSTTVDSSEFDVLWHRRPQMPVLPDALDPSDREAAANAWRDFFESTWYAFDGKFVVNPIDGYHRSNSKALQLAIAKSEGLRVPSSLFSNDPTRIREFVASAHGGAIFKNFYPTYWRVGSKIYSSRTVPVTASDLSDDAAVRAAPGIYQQRIEKAYEIRATFFGATCLAARIDSQAHERGRVDWRNVPVHQLGFMQMELPAFIEQACRRVMKRLGICFGCFDLLVTPSGDHYFLEVNEMGQFLWIERVNPAIPMLETFTNFLISKDPEYAGQRFGRAVASAEIFGSGEFRQTLKNDERVHVTREAVTMILEEA